MNYSSLGFKAGVEIHQRIDSKKLFCECYANPSEAEEKIDERECLRVTRFLRPVVGELGVVDPAAAFEAGKKNKFVYLAPRDSSCLVELDDEPPHALNAQALETALEVVKALHATPVDEIHVMRKIVVDGSAVSGFQRTALVGVNGFIETTRGRVGIQTISLEEESSGIVEQRAGETVYRLDRQGIPLVEVATDASLQDGEHARETAEAIGLVLRNTGRMQRGIGSIRQDLNVSIAQGARVEIKGVQELKNIPKIIENEVARQVSLLELRKLLTRKPASQEQKIVDVTKLFEKTENKMLKQIITQGGVVLATRLQALDGLLKRELASGKTLGSEIADYARAASGLRGLIHSDEDPAKYALSREYALLSQATACAAGDAWAVTAGGKHSVELALNAAASRARLLRERVLEETRRAEGEASVFMRPLPGAARMYPETDASPARVDKKLFESIKIVSVADERKRLLEMGLNFELAERMLSSQQKQLFEKLVASTRNGGKHAGFIAFTLLETLVALKREGFETRALGEKILKSVFDSFASGEIVRAGVPELLKTLCGNPEAGMGKAIAEGGLRRVSGKELESLAAGFLGKPNAFELVMRGHRLRVDADELKKILEKK
jgi:glutamyl-tRNA(Gln) amidotransferase subunit E